MAQTQAQREVEATLRGLGGVASISQIARRCGRKLNGVGKIVRQIPGATEVPNSGTGSGVRWQIQPLLPFAG